jgi:AraC family transcriptional activator of tynA and feaB
MHALKFFVRDRNNLSVPLRNCLYFLNDRFMVNDDEVAAILDAILSLLPLEAGSHPTESALRGQITELYSAILAFVEENLQDPSLSARLIAQNFGISERYVYGLFASRGLKLGAHVRGRRLQEAARELTFGCPGVTDLAYKWVNDLSTFSRAFKEKFGCSPLEFRARY